MRAAVIHAGARLRACFSHPGSAILLIVGGLMTTAYWPSPAPASTGRQELVMLFMWVGLWPAILMLTVTGRSTSSTGRLGFGVPMPALPVSRAGRIVAETLVVLLLGCGMRVLGLLAGGWMLGEVTGLAGSLPGPGPLSQLAAETAVGAVIVLPSVLLWAIPAGSFEVYWLRPHAASTLLVVAVKLGLLATPLAALLTGAVLSVAAVVLFGPVRTGASVALWRWLPRRGLTVRAFRDPISQMHRDIWLGCMPWAVGLLAAELIVLAADALWSLPGHPVYLGSTMVFSCAVSIVALRPAGSKMAIAGVWGMPGFRPGDFVAAWAPLPVPRVVLLRSVYLYGLTVASLIWAGAVATNLFCTWRASGELALRDMDGDPARGVFLLFLPAVPCIAGFVTCAAAGDRSRAYLAGAGLLASIFVQLPLWTMQAPQSVRVAVTVAIVVVGGVPALGLLRFGGIDPEEHKP